MHVGLTNQSFFSPCVSYDFNYIIRKQSKWNLMFKQYFFYFCTLFDKMSSQYVNNVLCNNCCETNILFFLINVFARRWIFWNSFTEKHWRTYFKWHIGHAFWIFSCVSCGKVVLLIYDILWKCCMVIHEISRYQYFKFLCSSSFSSSIIIQGHFVFV